MTLTLKTALRLGRVSNVPTVWTNVAAGIALAGAPFKLGPWLALCLAMSALYVGGMYLNDAFDQRWDKQHRPDRPIVAGLVSARTVLIVGFSLLIAGIACMGIMALVGASTPGAVASSLLLAGLILYYNLHHKGNPLGPLVMGLCRVGVYVTTCMSFGPPTPMLWLGSALLLGHLIGLTYIAKHETRGKLLRLWPVLLFLPAAVFSLSQAWPWMLMGILYCGHTMWAGVAPALGWNRSRQANPGRAVPSLIAGISLFDAVLVARTGSWSVAGLCVVAFALTRFWQRHVPGT